MIAALVHLVVRDRDSHVFGFHISHDGPHAYCPALGAFPGSEIASKGRGRPAHLEDTIFFQLSTRPLLCALELSIPSGDDMECRGDNGPRCHGLFGGLVRTYFGASLLLAHARRYCSALVCTIRGMEPAEKKDQHQAAVNVSEFCACADGTMHLDMKAVTT